MDDWLSLRARTHPDHPAVVGEGFALTYAELDRSVPALERGELVVAPARRDLEFVRLFHACVRHGAVLVPTDPREPRPQVGVEGVGAGEGDTVLFTSGTTAAAKAVVLTRANHEASAIASAWNLGVAPDDRWLCVLPVHHVGGLAILWRSLIYGTTVILHERFDPGAVNAAVERGEVTLASLVPTMLRRMRAAGLSTAGRLRALLLGGGPVPRELLEWAMKRGLPALQTYGMTETASQIATLRAEEAVTHHGSAGRPLLGVELAIGDGGEILARGPMVSAGALADDGWLHTGDTGHLDEDGFLHLHGRLDDVIVTGGENVQALEVEEAVLSHPAVADAAVAGRPDREWGEAVTAWVVLATHVPDGELAAHCRARLASFKVPKAFVRVDELPRNAAGKVVRARLSG
ncbi:MAG: o-succinylbenzoate---CoA ligase [Thermoleophilaceae bacterium]|nr:o-succinylbenzoate---CoA ligase [Thermoleophilaceae bacterium]